MTTKKRRRFPKAIRTKFPRGGEAPAGTRAVGPAREIALAEMKVRIFALRRQGISFARIASELGCSAAFAHSVMTDELQRLSTELALSREQHRALELERLDALMARLEVILRDGRPASGYFQTYLHVLEQRAKLLGLNAPDRIELSANRDDEHDVSEEELLARADQLRREIDEDNARMRFATAPPDRRDDVASPAPVASDAEDQ